MFKNINNHPDLLTHMERTVELTEKYQRIAIHASLMDILMEALEQRHTLIVELGVSDLGLSTKVLNKVAEINEAEHIGCDIKDCAYVSDYKRWSFVHCDDIRFASIFPKYCQMKHIDPAITLLFIDTDERYFHVKLEIESWFPFLAPECTVMFRCTNLQPELFYKDGTSTRLGWDNQRGVIRALTEYLGQEWDETQEFEERIGEWGVKHWPWGGGLTVIRR